MDKLCGAKAFSLNHEPPVVVAPAVSSFVPWIMPTLCKKTD